MRVLTSLATLAVAGGLILPATAPAGSIERAIREANRINRRGLPYVWGGGHGLRPPAPHKVSGYDCSGAVSRVLYVAGLLKRTRTSYEFEHWGKRGHGPISVRVRPGHVFLVIRGRAFGTSAKNREGGAGWFKAERSYLRQFRARRPG